ncbi:MAG: ABC transporter ATP-binding protein [Deltaproteobacteria bacterium]|nr:ABC transporter ATP-binding protein [Deltaproteobacteria bacterium]
MLPELAPDRAAPPSPPPGREPQASPAPPPMVEIRDLSVSFGRGRMMAVRGVGLELSGGEVVGLVGESGSGKSLTALSLMGLLPHGARQETGTITFKGESLADMPPKKRREMCGRNMGMVFQEPLTALNPVLTIGEQVSEIFRIRLGKSRAEAGGMALGLLSQVGLPNPRQAMRSYPHRFSGGMRQRVVIAMALALDPELVVADEPTTALDPTIAAQIIRLLSDMAADRGSAVLFITHNLRLLPGLASRVLVMYAGLIVEQIPGGDLADPGHPYTRGLLRALPPAPSERRPERLVPIPGQPPSPGDLEAGCPFAPRCPVVLPPCRRSLPALLETAPGRLARCHRCQGA